MSKIQPPHCGNYGCNNRVPLDRWVWAESPTHTCSDICAHEMRKEADPPPRLKAQCARPGCGNRIKEARARVAYCSRSCARRMAIGDKPGQNIRILPGDRWEKVAPKMRRPDLGFQARALFFEEQHR